MTFGAVEEVERALVGEAGTIAASPAVTNAVIDALRPLGVTYINMPLSPMRVWETIQEAKT